MSLKTCHRSHSDRGLATGIPNADVNAWVPVTIFDGEVTTHEQLGAIYITFLVSDTRGCPDGNRGEKRDVNGPLPFYGDHWE